MGNKHLANHQRYPLDEENSVKRNSFEFLYVIGKGGFGKVWRVYAKKYKKHFALKEMSKAKIIDKKSEKSIRFERDLLARIKSPFIVNMQMAFQDHDNLYLVMDLLTGGDLRYQICKNRKFTEEQTKFFMACMILGLEYLHGNGVMHRDLKPENLVLDERGYLRMTDFGVAKIYQLDNSSETSGTPGYMAPEVMCAQNHGFPVDYYALGVMGYEFMFGKRPYLGKSRKEIKENILARQVSIKREELPSDWSIEAGDFINRLIQRKPHHRLGEGGIKDLKGHVWFSNFSWKELYAKAIVSPFIPKSADNYDKKYCESIDKIGNDTLQRYENISKEERTQSIFKDYYFLSSEFDDFNYNSNFKLTTTTTNKTPNLKLTKEIQEKEILKDFKIPISSSNKNLNLPNITRYKSGDFSDLTAALRKADLNQDKKKLKRNPSTISTNSSSNNFTNGQNPHLLKIKSFTNLGGMIMRHQGGGLNKLSYSSKNLKFS